MKTTKTNKPPFEEKQMNSEGKLTVCLRRIFKRKRSSSFLHGKRLRRRYAIISEHAKKRMKERGICLSAMNAAIEFGRKEKDRETTCFWLSPGIIRKWKLRGIDLSWAESVQVLVRGAFCITTYQKFDDQNRSGSSPGIKLQEGKPFNWARIKNRIFADEDWNFQMVA